MHDEPPDDPHQAMSPIGQPNVAADRTPPQDEAVTPHMFQSYMDGLVGCCLFQLRLDPNGRLSVPHATQGLAALTGVAVESLCDDIEPLTARLGVGARTSLLRSLVVSARALTRWSAELCLDPATNAAPALQPGPEPGTGRWLLCDAMPRRMADGGTTWIGHLVDVSRQRHAEQRAHRLAYYDPLTCLPNRRLLADRLARVAAGCGRRREHGAVLFIDLDDFKLLNDTRGHDVGDLLLVEVARRLQTCLRTQDMVSRLGGDEFVVLLDGLGQDEADAASRARRCAERIRVAIDQPWTLHQQVFQTRASIGIALFDGPEQVPGEVLRRADIAMYAAKRGSGEGLLVFSPSLQDALDQRLALTVGMRHALAERQLELHVQPQRDRDGRLRGGEALLRWRHPLRGVLAPGEFLPQLGRSGLDGALSRWVLRRGCGIARAWQDQPALRDLRLSVNVTPSQFCQSGFTRELRTLVDELGIPPGLLMLELTEEVMREGEAARGMTELKRAGIGFALDDFGTGFSSMARLKDLPFDEIKVDASFVRDLEADATARAMVRAILGMARSLGLVTVAEGVETVRQRAILAEEGCEVFQGFLLGQAVTPDAFARLAQEG